MKKITLIFFTAFISLNIFAQCTDDNIAGATASVYMETSNASNFEVLTFNDQLRLIDLGNDIYDICSNRLVTDDMTTYNDTIIDITKYDPKKLMCYYHLNNAWNYIASKSYNSVLTNMPAVLEFNPSFNDGMSTVIKPQYQVTVSTVGGDLPMLEYSISETNNYTPLAEDAFSIVSGFYQFVHEVNMTLGSRATAQGVDHGISSYFTGRYMVENGFTTITDLEGHKWGGLTDGISTSKWQKIDFNLGGLYLKYGFLDLYYDKAEFNDFKDSQPQSELLTAALWQLGKGLGFEKIDQLLSQNYSSFDQTVSSQANFGVVLHNTASDSNIFSPEELCYIHKVFGLVYGDDFISNIDIDLSSESSAKDYLIRDSYQGQIHKEHGIQGEDIGNEPNDITTAFSSSPDIWNRLTADIDNDKTHQNPIYENGNTNYLYVDVRLESCAIPTADDYLHLYVRESHLSANWPIDWTEGYYEAGNPNTPLVGYEVTDVANNNELDPNYSQGIPMTDYTSLQIERYVDANTGAEKLYKIYRYEIPWVPINPSDLPDYPMDANIDVTMLARIVSPSDTMKITEVAYVSDNVRNNNNIALRSEIVISFPSSIAPEDMGTETNNAVLNIKKPDAVPGLQPSDDEYSISLTIHPQDTMAVAPLVSISDSGDGAIIAFDYLNIELELSDLLMDAWSVSGLQGEGFEWVGDQRIKITSPTFAMQNLSLADNTNYRMIVSTTAIDNYREISFSLGLVDEEANTIGSQLYETQGSQFGTIILSNDNIALDLDITQTFPNPTDDRLNIVNDKGWDRYCIYNIDGIIVQNGDLISGLNLVEVGELQKGLYIIAFRDRRGNVMTQKIVKL